MYVTLMYDKAHTSTDLINMADARREMDFYVYHSAFSEDFRVANFAPNRVMQGKDYQRHDVVLQEIGRRDGVQVARLYVNIDGRTDYIETDVNINNQGHPEYISVAGQRDLMKRVYSEYLGPVEWSPA